MKKQTRGSYHHRFDTNNEILSVKWLNTHVIVGMNYDTVEVFGKVQ